MIVRDTLYDHCLGWLFGMFFLGIAMGVWHRDSTAK